MMAKQKTAAIVIAALLAFYSGCATAADSTSPEVPDTLKVPSNRMLSLEARGIGVQIYECREDKAYPSKFGWVFKAPEAELFDSAGKRIGKHYAGPTWESEDGSKVAGEVEAIYNSPDANSITWLLLNAKANSGSGVFSRTVSIQRLNTSGGKAPAEGCGREQAGKQIRVPYKALYYFYNQG
jgi:hypothetical protein